MSDYKCRYNPAKSPPRAKGRITAARMRHLRLVRGVAGGKKAQTPNVQKGLL